MSFRRRSRLIGLCFHLLAAGLFASAFSGRSEATPQAPHKLDYNKDIRPILGKCFTCHGEDAGARMAALRLDQKAGATTKLPTGHYAIVAGNPDQSELIKRITSKDEAKRMPPPFSNLTLSDAEKETLKQWIKEGADYRVHWAFVKPVRREAPKVKLKSWPKSPIDAFVLARMEKRGLKPSPEADRRTLIRRVTLDLTGIPPTPAEVEAFVRDKSGNAYEKVVDRLLKSPRYGERMAMDWMDYARYADSNGYQADYERFQWRWRDWVINAFNQNMPYDEFTVEQLAGDLLPNATLDQKIATGFGRNHRINTEGGVIAQEWKVENVVDRVETTSAIWLGLTTGCARCHDHKYDPVSQKEFYSLFAYFNNIPESGTGEERPVNHPPFIPAPYPDQRRDLQALEYRIANDNLGLRRLTPINAKKATDWTPPEPPAISQEGLEARYVLGTDPRVAAGQAPKPTFDGAVQAAGARSTGAVTTHDKAFVDLGNVADFDTHDKFSVGVWLYPDRPSGAPLSRMDVKNAFRGWDIFLQQGGRPAMHFIHNWPSDAVKVISRATLPTGRWSHVLITYDGSAKQTGFKIYVDGKLTEHDVETDALKGTTKTPVSTKIGRRTGADSYFGKSDDVVFYRRVLSAAEAARLADVHPAKPLLAIPKEQRTRAQQDEFVHLWSRDHDKEYRKLDDDKQAAIRAKEKLNAEIPTVMVMEEMPKPAAAHVLIRGQYDKLGEAVKPGVPAALPPLPKGVKNNRLGLAKWIVSGENPLTARVTVNRMWERLFGAGIVTTIEDFGTRAAFPTHPELLDWLATEFVRLKWDQKAMWKTLVMSATYRQSSRVTPTLLSKDPENKLYARGPRFRLPAEVLRDQALASSGLLVEKIGGRSVRPYQPEGIWDETNVYGNLRNYQHDTDGGQYRRSLYTIWKRTAAPPNMTLFDVPGREACRVRRARTNTPLQALALLNDVTYIEAARALAQRMMKEGGVPASKRIAFAYRAVVGREPTARETLILSQSLVKYVSHYRKAPIAAKNLLSHGDLKTDSKLDAIELAAYTLIASTILNLDETLNKE